MRSSGYRRIRRALSVARALASCRSAGCSCTVPVCCGWLFVSLFSGASFLVDSILGCSLGVEFAAVKVSIWDASFAFGVAVDPVVAESAPRSCVAESAEATCVCEAGFHPNKPNNLLANEPLLSGGCSGRDPDGGTRAGGILPQPGRGKLGSFPRRARCGLEPLTRLL